MANDFAITTLFRFWSSEQRLLRILPWSSWFRTSIYKWFCRCWCLSRYRQWINNGIENLSKLECHINCNGANWKVAIRIFTIDLQISWVYFWLCVGVGRMVLTDESYEQISQWILNTHTVWVWVCVRCGKRRFWLGSSTEWRRALSLFSHNFRWLISLLPTDVSLAKRHGEYWVNGLLIEFCVWSICSWRKILRIYFYVPHNWFDKNIHDVRTLVWGSSKVFMSLNGAACAKSFFFCFNTKW